MLEGMGGSCPLPFGCPGGLPREILKILMKIGVLWCNLEPVLYRIKHRLRIVRNYT